MLDTPEIASSTTNQRNFPVTLQTLLGFDFGRLRIGIAVGQMITRTATAVCTLDSRNERPDWDAISALINQWQPDALVVGLPLHADNSDSNFTKAARKFARQLEERYRLPVHTMDERLSSLAAIELQNQGMTAGNKGLDAIAASIILQNWLETNNTYE